MTSIEHFKGFPLEYEWFLLEKYASFIATCRYVEIYYPEHEVSYMLVKSDDVLTDLLFFGNKGNTATCFNALACIDQEILLQCIDKLFDAYPAIKKVLIDASYRTYTLPKSVLSFVSDNHILNLPETLDDFYAQLGSKTRKHIKARNIKLGNEFQNVKYVLTYGTEIDESVVGKIIDFNRDRMKQKGKVPGINDNSKNKIYQYSTCYGCVAYIELNGELVAGCIATIINSEIFLHVIAHDINYSKYNVGEVCVFFLIQTAIEKRMPVMHFLWGKSELKRRFLARPSALYSYYVFRSYSLSFLISKFKMWLDKLLVDFKESKLSTPVRNLITNFRKKFRLNNPIVI